MVTYTKEMTYAQLVSKLKEIAKEYKAKVIKDEMNEDFKVTSHLMIKFQDGSYVEFYDYKETNKYSDSKPTVAKFRKTPYEWHVQGSNELLTKQIKELVNF